LEGSKLLNAIMLRSVASRPKARLISQILNVRAKIVMSTQNQLHVFTELEILAQLTQKYFCCYHPVCMFHFQKRRGWPFLSLVFSIWASSLIGSSGGLIITAHTSPSLFCTHSGCT